MMKKQLILGWILLSPLFLFGCSQSLSDGDTMVEAIALLDAKGNLIGSISDERKVREVEQLLSERTLTKEKILPLFEYELRVKEQSWLLTTNGYIRDNSVANGKIYTLKQTRRIVEIFSVE